MPIPTLRRRALAPLTLLAALGLNGPQAWAQADAANWPDKPVRMLVPFPPGGGTDALARILTTELTRIWGQPVVVDNRAGAQGSIGTQAAVKSAPDGYTIVFAHQGVMTVNPHLYRAMGFDPLKDWMPVTRGTEQPFVLVANPALPAQNLAELTAMARGAPGKLSFASSASGPQMAGEMYKLAAGVDMLHIPYQGAGPAVVDLLANTVSLMVANPTSVAPHIKAGKLRGLVVFGAKRLDILPEVPTAAEAGLPDLGANPEWYGFGVPSGTPPAIVQKLNRDLTAALMAPQAQKSIRDLGMMPSPSTPEEFARQIRADYDTWGKVVKASGAKVEGN